MNVISTPRNDDVITVMLAKNAGAGDTFQAYVSAKLLQQKLLLKGGIFPTTSTHSIVAIKSAWEAGVMSMKTLLPSLKRSGWDMDRILLHDLGWRIDWCDKDDASATRTKEKEL